MSYGLERKSPLRQQVLVMLILAVLAGIIGGVLVGLATDHQRSSSPSIGSVFLARL